MRKYENEPTNRLNQIICNKCGKILKLENGFLKEGCFSADYSFGYFSGKDGDRHKFDLCEECYDNWIADMAVPVEISEEKELF